MRSSLSLVLILLGVATGCATVGNEGERCSSPGVSESEYASEGLGGTCAEGLICAPDRASTHEYSAFSTASCRDLCTSSADCPDGYTCRGVSGAETRQACLPVAAD